MKKPVPITLTEGINRAGQEALVELILHTFPGQAHLAGSGPCGRTCGECGFCACRNSSGRAGPGDQSSASAPCLKARQLSHGRCQSEIPHFAAACRHFEPTEPNEEVKTSD
jgi:hypothetical protein